jgi:hypothetical protein
MKNGVLFVIRYELRLWEALFRWAFRRPHRVQPGTATFGYVGAVTMLFGVFIGLSAVEIPILHLLLPWPIARKISLMVGAYGLFWIIGLYATLRTRPHLVGPSGLRIRNGNTMDMPIPWGAVAAVRARRRSLPPGGQTQVEQIGQDRVLSVGMGSQTSVDVMLSRPLSIDVKKTRGEPVTQIRFHADEPEALAAAAKTQLDARRAAPELRDGGTSPA